MKILHTSDWHFGKMLEGNSRIEEQQLFAHELIEIAEKENIDLVLISGDIYDNYNPSASAERLFYWTLDKLVENKKTVVAVIAGNHDSPERLTAVLPLIEKKGVLMFGVPKSSVKEGDFGYYKILKSGEGFFEIEINNEKAVVITMPYPSEKRLGELIGENIEQEEENQEAFSEKMGQVFRGLEKNYRKDTINLAMGHFFIYGGQESSSERPIQLGGSPAVMAYDLPLNAQYIAMGHLHRPQTVPGTNKKCFYSGSPLQYSKDEANFAKAVNVIEVYPEKEAIVKKIMLKNYKPIEIWKAENIIDAIDMCHKHSKENTWVYLTIKTDRVIEQDEIKQMKAAKADIVEIMPIFQGTKDIEVNDDNEKSIVEMFSDFYREKRGAEPSDDIIKMFVEILNEGDEVDAAAEIED